MIDQQVADVPILIFGLKSDLPAAVTGKELDEVLGISSTRGEKVKKGEISFHTDKKPIFVRASVIESTSIVVQWHDSYAI